MIGPLDLKVDLSYLPEGDDKQKFDNDLRARVEEVGIRGLNDTEFNALNTINMNEQKTRVYNLTHDMEAFSMLGSAFSASIAVTVVVLGASLALAAAITPIGGALLLLTSIFATVLAPAILAGGILGTISLIYPIQLDNARDKLDQMQQKFETQAQATAS